MTEIRIDAQAACVRVRFADGTESPFPFIWLRDNCPTGFHAQTEERTFDLLSVPADVCPNTVSVDDDALVVAWDESDHVSRISLGWLKANRPGQLLADPAAVPPRCWRSETTRADLPTGDAATLMTNDAALLEWLIETRAVGLGLIVGIDDDVEAGFAIAGRIGFLRETNFGRTFEVISKPDPNNLAYTAHALPLHTDLPNQELPPGFQFLHCIANDAQGGGSVFCDGFAVAEDLRTSDPAAFELLARIRIPFRFQDSEYDIRKRDTVIRCAPDGALEEIRFNAHIAGILDMPAEDMVLYYQAYRAYMATVRDPAYHLRLKLDAGQMAVFDNRRVLHGREAFDPSTGFRRLRGCYVDRGEWDSRIRILSRPAAAS